MSTSTAFPAIRNANDGEEQIVNQLNHKEIRRKAEVEAQLQCERIANLNIKRSYEEWVEKNSTPLESTDRTLAAIDYMISHIIVGSDPLELLPQLILVRDFLARTSE